MTQPSTTLKQLVHLFKVVVLNTIVFGVLGFGVSVTWHSQSTPLYHSQALISLTKVRHQQIGTTKYVRYSNGSELTQLFSDNFKAPTTDKAVRQALKKADLAADFDQPGAIMVEMPHNSGLIQINATSHKRTTAIKGANIAAKVAVQQFTKRYQLQNSQVLVRATSADRQITTISRSEIMLKFMFAGMLLGFLWIFVRELWQRRSAAK